MGSHLGVPCGLDLKSQSLVIERFSVGSRAVLSAWRSFRCFAASKKSRQRFVCFSSHGFLAVCEIHSVWAVLLVILNEVEVCPLFAALRVFCHAQHIRNMHATWRVARPRNAVIYDVSRFFRSRDVKKVEFHLKDWLSRKCAEEARNIVNYRVAWPRNTPCCVHVAYVLRMTKPTQRCEGCEILKCL